MVVPCHRRTAASASFDSNPLSLSFSSLSLARLLSPPSSLLSLSLSHSLTNSHTHTHTHHQARALSQENCCINVLDFRSLPLSSSAPTPARARSSVANPPPAHSASAASSEVMVRVSLGHVTALASNCFSFFHVSLFLLPLDLSPFPLSFRVCVLWRGCEGRASARVNA